MSTSKELDRFLKDLDNNWEVSYTGSGHWRLRHAKGVVFISSTPGDRRWLKNSQAKIRRIERSADD